MKTVIISKFGGPEVINMVEQPLPAAERDKVLIKVAYAGINPLDWKVRSGSMKMVTGKKLPQKPGYECSGLVSETGPGVKELKPGDRVIAATGMKGGAYSEYIALPEKNCAKLPENIDLKTAGGSYICGLTAYQSLLQKGKLDDTKSVMIIGAAGGVGSFATQIARVIGADVTAVCSTKNESFVKDLGASRVIDYTKENVSKVGSSFDLIFDAVNAHSWSSMKPLLKPNGIYLNTFPTPSVFLKQILTGILPGKKCKTYLMNINQGDINWVLKNMAIGEISIRIDRVFSFEQVSEAISENEKGRTRGKIILAVDPSMS